MIRKGCLLLAALASVLQAALGGQGASNWRIYKVADGLSEEACFSVTVGPKHGGEEGRVWMEGTRGKTICGLDGYTIREVPTPGREFGSRVYESPGGQLWAVCEDGLKEYREERWIHYPVGEIASELRPRKSSEPDQVPLCPVRTGCVIFLLPDGLFEFVTDSQSHSSIISLLPANHTKLERFLGMTVARDGGMWISGVNGLAHNTNGSVRTLTPATSWQEYLVTNTYQVRNLRAPQVDEEGGITTVAESTDGSQKVVLRFGGANWDRTIPAGGENIRLAWRGPDKVTWAASSDSLFQVDEIRKELVANEELSARQYSDMALEPGGTFWLATSAGLCRYSPPMWRTPAAVRNLNSAVDSITEDQAGRLWFASRTALGFLANGMKRSFPLPTDYSGERGLFAMTNGNMVMAAGDRLLQFNPQKGEFNYVSPPHNKVSIRPAGLLKDGSLCVEIVAPATDGGTSELAVFDGDKVQVFPYAQPTNNLGSNFVLLTARSGSLWLRGTKGIARFRGRDWEPFTSTEEPMPSDIQCMAEVNEDRLWCGTKEQIEECDGKSWHVVRPGLNSANNMLVGSGSDISIWVATDSGLERTNHGAWAANGPDEGLPSEIVRALFEDRSGQIWAGTSRGLSLYHPEADPAPPKTTAHNPGGSEGAVREETPVVISFPGQDKWNYTPVERLLYSYRMDNADWQWFVEEKSVTFPSLAPGKHYFQVRSMDRNWNVSDPELVEFAVVPPWYKESRLLLISSAGLAVALFFAGLAFNTHLQLKRSYAEVEAKVKLRTKQLEIAHQELLHSQKMNALGTLAAGIAHDFNNILSIIKGSAQIIEDNLDNQEKIRTRTNRISTVVEQGAGIVKAMLGFSRSSGKQLTMCDINAVVAETVKLLGDRFLREVEVQFEPAQSLPEVPASKDFIQQILLNLIFNSAEAMTERRQVILSTQTSNQLPASMVLAPAHATSYVSISVRDFGCGIAPDIMPRIFEPFFTTKSLSARRGTGLGLSMVYELARQVDAGLAVESVFGQGSTFTLIIPVRELPVDAADESA